MVATTLTTDHHGNPVSGTADEIARYDSALDRLLRYHPDVVSAMTALVEDAPDFAMGQVLAAYLCLTSTDVPDLVDAKAAFEQLTRLDLNEREATHRDVIGAWVDGDWHGASRRLDNLLIQWPADLLALLVGHQLDFFLGNAANLRDRIGRSLHAVDCEHPHHGFVRGMFAFGLEESGHYEQAERHGLAAVDTNPDDVWAIHALVHAYEMRGQVDTGIRFLRSRKTDWADGNLFTVHNWWHLGLFLLEAERTYEAMRIYDDRIHNAGSAGVPLEMLDASAMLWRLQLDEIDTGGRFAPLADAWATRTADAPWYAFNDLHAVIAFAGAGRLDDARAVVNRLERYVARASDPERSNVIMTARIGLPACRAIVAFTERRDGDVLAELLPIRTVFARFGGSHAQRDVLHRTLLSSAIRSGRVEVARALIGERLALRDASVYSLRRLADVHRNRGNAVAGRDVDATAAAIRDRFATAATAPQTPVTTQRSHTMTTAAITADANQRNPLHVESWGHGTPVVLVHGSLATGAEEWEAQRPLAGEGFRLLVPDRRGYGLSPEADGEDFLRDAEDMAELMGDGAHLVGHSYGGLGVLYAAARRPEATLSLTLLEPATFTLGQHDPAGRELVTEVLDMWDQDTSDDEWVVAFLKAVGSDPDEFPPDFLAAALPLVPVLRRGRPVWSDDLPLGELANARFPKLIVSGGHSAGFDVISDDLANRIGATRQVVAGAGHEIQFTGPPINDALLALWRTVS